MGASQQLLGKVVDLLQVASILSAAAFAALALFTEYKRDGKITRYGRFAVLGIVLSALFSLGMQWTKAEIDRQKAEQARKDEVERQKAAARAAADELERYKTQTGRLQNLLGLERVALDGTRHLAERMAVSLRQQQAIQAQTRGTLLAVEAARSQERANTVRVLKGMWEDANRVSGATIAVVVGYQCTVDPERYVPILPDQARAELTLLPMAAAAAEHVALTRFRPDYILGSRTLTSLDERTTLIGDPLGEVQFQQISRFSPFSFGAKDLQVLGRPEDWRGMAVELRIIGTQRELADRVAAVARKPSGSRDQLAHKYDVTAGTLHSPKQDQAVRVAVLPCTADMAVFINDRQVADAQGLVVELWDGPSDRTGQVIVKFPIVPVDTADFPRFGGSSVPRRASRSAPRR